MVVPLKPLKWYRDLATKKGRSEAGAFAVEGRRAIEQIASNQPDRIIEILSVEEPGTVFQKFPVRRLAHSQYLSVSSAKTPQGIMAIVRLPEEICSAALPRSPGNKILLLEDIQDPGNVGTLIRTAAAFDFSGIILTDKCADPFAPKCVQATAGSVLAVWLRRTPEYLDLARSLRNGGYYFVAADLEGSEDTGALSRREKLVLALGNEAAGLSPALLDIASCRMRLPTNRRKAESLNVAACGAICMFLSSGGCATADQTPGQ
jgi:TrmH family RNA methyltransferase